MQAVIICTRNRPEELRRTLDSTAEQHTRDRLSVLVVDSSDATVQRRNRLAVAEQERVCHLSFSFAPSLPRQRNYGLDHLPETADVVHFVDDDVVLEPGYLRLLAQALREHPEAGGAGGLVLDPPAPPAAPQAAVRQRLRRSLRSLFLLAGASPGRVLPSGHAVPAQRPFSSGRRTEWLSGCSMSFPRDAVEAHRFDEERAGYTTYDDVDFSYRISRQRPLIVVPEARLVHYRSPTNRHDTGHFACEALVTRYWFVEKNIRHPLRKSAFWWATLGQALARIASRKPAKWAALRGLWQGVCAVWQRDHPLLRPERS